MADNERDGSGPQSAVKTTIVGGQPPGNQRDLEGRVPVGIEELLAMAAVDDDFAEALDGRRAEAIEASGVALTDSERAILGTVDRGALEQMVAGVRGLLPEQARREFLGRSAAAMMFLMGGGAALGAQGCNKINPMIFA